MWQSQHLPSLKADCIYAWQLKFSALVRRDHPILYISGCKRNDNNTVARFKVQSAKQIENDTLFSRRAFSGVLSWWLSSMGSNRWCCPCEDGSTNKYSSASTRQLARPANFLPSLVRSIATTLGGRSLIGTFSALCGITALSSRFASGQPDSRRGLSFADHFGVQHIQPVPGSTELPTLDVI